MFEEVPTAELWAPHPQNDSLTYEHVLAEAGEKVVNTLVTLECDRRRAALGARYYAALLFTLTHKRYPAAEARALWMRILTHRDLLTTMLGRNPGIAVTALDFLSNVEHDFTRPTIIDELKLTRLINSATTDSLTGLYDRATLRVSLERAFETDAQPIGAIMIDIDHFKNFNDTHGHLAGDRVLIRVSEIVRQSVRDTDIAARYGGEELCVVLPGRSLAEAVSAAERLRATIEHELRAEGVTASFGVACYPEHADHPLALLGAADAALYVSKNNGRNRVSVRGWP